MLSVAEARTSVLARVPALARERVALDAAVGRVLATDVCASRALPGFASSAMDGYAARAADLPGTLALAGVIGAGEVRTAPVPARHAVRIFTGAPLPADLDTVVMQEDATRDGERVTLPAAAAGEHVRRAGEDVAVGAAVLRAGTRLRAWDLGVLAALGVAHVAVARQPTVAIIATGDELVDLATEPGPGQLVDSSAHALAALVREAGGVPHGLGIARDELGAITALLQTAVAAHDVVITTGGVSVGDRDHVREALAAAGVALEIYTVAMKPGKPFSFGHGPGHGGTQPVFGLPGNPVSTIVGFELFVRPALLAMQGAGDPRPRAVVELPAGYAKPAGRAHYLRARVDREGARLVAHVHAKQGSAMLSSLLGTNALVEIAADVTEISPGGTAPAFLLEAV